MPALTTTGQNGATQGSYDTASVVLTAGKRYFIATSSRVTGGGHTVSSVQHDPTGSPLSFTLVTDGTTNARQAYTSSRTVEVWSVKPVSTTASAVIRITWSATVDGCDWGVWEETGDGTFRQVVINTSTSTSATATLAALLGGSHVRFVVSYALDFGAGSISPDEARAELYETTLATDSFHSAMHYEDSASDNTLTATLSVSDVWGAIGIEFVPASGAFAGFLGYREV